MKTTLLIAAITAMIVVPFVSSASAQQLVLQTIEAGQKLEPIRVAPVLGWENGKRIIGKWQAYNKNATDGAGFPTGVILDSYEGDTFYGNPDLCDADPASTRPCNGALSGGIDPACDFALGYTGDCESGDNTRWFVGIGGTWAGAIGPMGSFADNAPTVSTGQCFAWYQSYGSDSAPPCETYFTTYAIIEIFDNSVASLIDGISELNATTLGDGFIDGLILDFGPVATGGYYFANIDLTLEDPELHLGIVDGVEVGIPQDGALEILYWDDDGLGNIVPGTYAQSMLWDAKDASLQGAWADGIYYLDGSTDGITYDCPAYDGEYLIATNDDWFNFNDQSWPGGCPNYLMPMIGLFGEEGTPAIEICPDSATVTAGTTFSGSSADICDEDSAIWTLQSTTFAAAFSPAPIAITFEGTANPVGGTDVTLRLIGGPEFGNDAAFIQLRMFNFSTGAYVGMPFIAQPDSDNTVYEFTNPVADFVGPNGELRAEITCAKTVVGPVRLRMDQVGWQIQ